MRNYDEVVKAMEKVAKKIQVEFDTFKEEEFKKTAIDVFYDAAKIFIYDNFALFFANYEMKDLVDNLYDFMTDDVILDRFLSIDNLLFQLYDFELGYDEPSYHTTWDEIIDMLHEFINDLKYNN